MGNCTSKKSAKSLKLSVKRNSVFEKKMEKEPDFHSKRLSKKIAPCTRGEVTSFGFKKKTPSQLPVPVTLTSNGHAFTENGENTFIKGAVNQVSMNEGYQSGSSVESLCHAPFRSTPKMIRKRDVVRQQVSSAYASDKENNGFSENIVRNTKTSLTQSTSQTVNKALVSHNEDSNRNTHKNNSDPPINRFGFRQSGPIKSKTEVSGKSVKSNALPINRCSILNSQGPIDTGSRPRDKNSPISSRSKSEGPREAFFKQVLQPANSEQNGLNHSKTHSFNSNEPGKFTFQTSHLPRPQFPVRMTDTKTAKTATNYYRRGGIRSESNSSKEGSANEDSGFESHPSANNTLEKRLDILESSPGCKVRKKLPAFKGKKLEMKIVGNKFELLKKDEKNSPDIITEVSVIKLPICNARTNTSIINTGLVEQRANQYLKKISQPFVSNKKDSNVGVNEFQKVEHRIKAPQVCQSNLEEEYLGAESEEEKLFKDSSKSEKISDNISTSNGFEELESMMPGEALAEDFSLCLKDLSLTDDISEIVIEKKIERKIERPSLQPEIDVTPNTIRLDALKLSKHLKHKNTGFTSATKNQIKETDSLAWEKDDETFCTDSILEQLSSDSDSLGDKGENKYNDKEKNLKINLNKKEIDESEVDIDDEDGNLSCKSDTDVDDNELDLNVDLTENKGKTNNCLGSASPDSPCTPTHNSNSLSISEGRDFLIDDEIADQPPLCFSEKFLEMSCQENEKIENDKTLTSVQGFETCQESNFITDASKEETSKNVENDEEMEKVDIAVNLMNGERRCKRLNSEGTLSPCESIASDDLMLDFETNSFEEALGRPQDLNESVPTDNKQVSANETVRDISSQNHNLGGGIKLQRRRDSSSGRSTPASAKSSDVVNHLVSSPIRSSRSNVAEEDSVRLDKTIYQNVFQDVVSMKAMLLKLKRLLSESEGNIQENNIYTNERIPDNILEDELTDLRRQVLFLQQQLEDREKMVQVLKMKIDKTEEKESAAAAEPKELSNATTQTGTEQFQKEFPHFRNFRATPVV